MVAGVAAEGGGGGGDFATAGGETVKRWRKPRRFCKCLKGDNGQRV